jgi:hypothetical protein
MKSTVLPPVHVPMYTRSTFTSPHCRAVAKVTKATREHPAANGTGANGGAADQWSTRAAEPVPAGTGAAGSDDLNPPF